MDLEIGATVVVVIGMLSSKSSTMVVLLGVCNVDDTNDSDADDPHATRDMQAAKVSTNFFIGNVGIEEVEML